MSTVVCLELVPFEGRCGSCYRPVIERDGKAHHRSGRHAAGVGPVAEPPIEWLEHWIAACEARYAALTRPSYAERLRATDLDDTICDCGLPLEGHPELPKVKPWRGWTSERDPSGPWRNTVTGRTYTPEQLANHRRSRDRMAGFSARHPGTSPMAATKRNQRRVLQ